MRKYFSGIQFRLYNHTDTKKTLGQFSWGSTDVRKVEIKKHPEYGQSIMIKMDSLPKPKVEQINIFINPEDAKFLIRELESCISALEEQDLIPCKCPDCNCTQKKSHADICADCQCGNHQGELKEELQNSENVIRE